MLVNIVATVVELVLVTILTSTEPQIECASDISYSRRLPEELGLAPETPSFAWCMF